MKRVFLALLLGVSASTANAGESVYTTLNLEKDCVFHTEYEQGAHASCSGYKGYPVHFSEGDLRQMVRFGHVRKLDGQWESFGQFNHINTVIEWRLKNNKPYAAILRWFIENSNEADTIDDDSKGQVLVVSTIGTHANPVSCVVGYVDARANSDANILARNLADSRAKSFRCGKDQAEFHGIRGTLSGDPTNWFE